MGRMSEVPTRHEVDETVEQHDKDMDEKLNELGTISEDTETVRETISALESMPFKAHGVPVVAFTSRP